MLLTRQPILLALLLFFLSIAVLLPGIGEVTSITGKDEYLLSMRTPIHMIEGDHGWLPWLDGEARLRKPPLIYWMGKISYETFGISLASARSIGVLFAALLVFTTSLIAWQIGKTRQYMLLAGLVMLGSAGIMIDGRRMMLDIPVAAFSALSVLFMILWWRTGAAMHAVFSAIALALGFMVKGPVALIFTGAGFVALMIADGDARHQLRTQWHILFAAVAVFFLVAAPWFVWLYTQYPDQLLNTFSEEVAARNLADISLDPVFSLFIMALPWSPVLIALLMRRDVPAREKDSWPSQKRFLLWWLLLSILPFFFFKSFGRYLYGCLIPLSLMAACMSFRLDCMMRYRMWFRTGAVISLLVGMIFFVAVIWFRGFDLIMLLPALFTIAFALTWWRADKLLVMAFAAILYWSSILGIVYPRLGINAIPEGIVDLVQDEYVVLFAGPQPALLPVVAGKGMRDTTRLQKLPQEKLNGCRGFLIFSPHKHFITAHMQLNEMKYTVKPLRRYRILSSRGSWARFAHEDATFDDGVNAIRNRDLDSLGTDVILVRATAKQCKDT
jgi:4-amino-4-deoxy-L-arabinose transferase-like glycosyltransferase